MKVYKEFLRLVTRGSKAEEDIETICDTLDSIFGVPSQRRAKDAVPAYRFIEKYQDLLVDAAWDWSAEQETSKAELRRLLRDYAIVARCSGHKLAVKDKEKALGEMSAIVTILLNQGTLQVE